MFESTSQSKGRKPSKYGKFKKWDERIVPRNALQWVSEDEGEEEIVQCLREDTVDFYIR